MEKKTIKHVFFVALAVLLASCATIPSAPGAYQPAPDTKSVAKEKPVVPTKAENKTVVVPTSEKNTSSEVELHTDSSKTTDASTTDASKTGATANGASTSENSDIYVQPEAAPTPEVKPEPKVKEETRSEVFVVVDATPSTHLKHYNVIIGSFGVKANAERLKASLMPSYNPVVVRNQRNMYRVVLNSFDDYQAAHRFIDDINGQFADAWVLVEK